MVKKQVCKKCLIPKTLDQFSESNYGPNRKRSTCKACDRIYQNEYNERKRRRPTRRVNIEERINAIVKMDRQAQELLSRNDRRGLKELAGQMLEFGMTQRARELEGYG